MKRRDTLKTLFVGSIAGGALLTGCKTDGSKKELEEVKDAWPHEYGRTPEEILVDTKLMEEEFFNAHEMETIAILVDIILPADEESGSATEAGVPDFIEFMMKDYERLQLPIRGGLMWLDAESNQRFDKEFKLLTDAEQIEIVEDIAYPPILKPREEPKLTQFSAGIKFFTQLRNLTMTGFFTSEIGIEALGYQGNRPNVWDGVPQDVLDKHGLAYEEEWLAKCINQDTRATVAEWDEEGNLIN
ncbi:MAG: hypothetical protein ACI920_002985 [Saprospiraceae bacterium]|jgi:hypothetical protein